MIKPITVRKIRRKPRFKRRYRIASREERRVQRRNEDFLDKPTPPPEMPKRKAKMLMVSPDIESYLKRIGSGSVSDGLEIIVDLMRDMADVLWTHNDWSKRAAQRLPRRKKGEV